MQVEFASNYQLFVRSLVNAELALVGATGIGLKASIYLGTFFMALYVDAKARC